MFRSFRVQGLVSISARVLWIALFAALTSCTEFVENTRVAIVIDAEADVREQIRYVDVEVRAGAKNAGRWDLKASHQLLPRDGQGWPLQFQFKRDEGDDADSYMVKATAFSPDDKELLVLLAMSTYVKGKTIELTLRFDQKCVMREQPCPKTFTCEQGECKDPLRDATKLPTRPEPDQPAPEPKTPVATNPSAAGSGADSKVNGGGAAGCSGACGGSPAPKPASSTCPARDTKGACLPCPIGFLGADADSCKPVLTSLAVPGLTPAFAPEVTEYTTSVPLLRESAKLTLAAVNGVEVLINGEPLEGKSEWTASALEIGSNVTTITLNAPGRPSRTYKLDLKRGGEQDPLVAPKSLGAGDAFGFSVAVSGDRLLVGAPFEDGSTANPEGDADDARKDSGAVYLYEYTKGAGWSEKAYLKAETPTANEHFGYSIAIDGDRFAVGASNNTGGAVYTFEFKNGVPVRTDVLRANPQGQPSYARAIAMQKDRLVVGVAGDNAGADEAGSVMVYEHDGSGWQFITKLQSETPGTWDYLGSSVALDGDLVASGATGRLIGGKQFAGVVYVFERGPAGWKQADVLVPPTPETSGFFGESVSISGNRIATSQFNGTVGLSPGSAHVFLRGASGKFTLENALRPNDAPQDGDSFGQRVLFAGDVLLIGATCESSGMPGLGADGSGMLRYSGALYLFSHASGMWQQQWMIKSTSPTAYEYFGLGLGAGGDRFVVGAATDLLPDGSSSRTGAAYAFH